MTAAVLPFRTVQTPIDPHEEFCARRAAMLRALAAWLSAAPDGDDLEQEVDGTINAVRAIVQLRGGNV